MPIKLPELKQHIHQSGFMSDPKLRAHAVDTIWLGLELFREYKKRSYYSHTGKLIKQPTAAHKTVMGRYNQRDARTILISAICRGWIVGVGPKPTLNNKRDYDSAFMSFASYILACEGVGHIHAHLEEYWSQRKQVCAENAEILKRTTFRGE
jgi:hypothetical protein